MSTGLALASLGVAAVLATLGAMVGWALHLRSRAIELEAEYRERELEAELVRQLDRERELGHADPATGEVPQPDPHVLELLARTSDGLTFQRAGGRRVYERIAASRLPDEAVLAWHVCTCEGLPWCVPHEAYDDAGRVCSMHDHVSPADV